MGRYLIRRSFLAIVSLLGLATAIFFALRMLPGGPFEEDVRLAPAVRAHLETFYGFNQPLQEQYLQFMGSLLKGNFGISILHSGENVGSVLLATMPRTLALGFGAMAFSVVVGCCLGILFFLTGSVRIVHFIHWFFLSSPTLFLGPIVILVFGVWLGWTPIVVGDSLTSYLLPLFVLAIKPTANTARLLMAALQETLAQPWVNTARAFGFSEHKILVSFSMRQSLIPVLSYLGPTMAGVFSGSLIVETLFNMQGTGTEFLQALVNRDYALISALTLFYGFILIFSTMLFDMLMYAVDPRMEKL